jgi:hypothetical protein
VAPTKETFTADNIEPSAIQQQMDIVNAVVPGEQPRDFVLAVFVDVIRYCRMCIVESHLSV